MKFFVSIKANTLSRRQQITPIFFPISFPKASRTFIHKTDFVSLKFKEWKVKVL